MAASHDRRIARILAAHRDKLPVIPPRPRSGWRDEATQFAAFARKHRAHRAHTKRRRKLAQVSRRRNRRVRS